MANFYDSLLNRIEISFQKISFPFSILHVIVSESIQSIQLTENFLDESSFFLHKKKLDTIPDKFHRL